MSAPLPLTGITVISLEQAVAAPLPPASLLTWALVSSRSNAAALAT